MAEPYLSDPDVTLYQGDALDVLRGLPDGSVHMCCTSPPFYGLRDYGTGTWEGGDPGCDHVKVPPPKPAERYSPGGTYVFDREGQKFGVTCGKCGARRVDRQIGLEETTEQWVERLVAVFREVRRVLRDDGTLWVEIGDSYNSLASNERGMIGSGMQERPKYADVGRSGLAGRRDTQLVQGLKTKDLLGQPWLLAFALRADGWYLRSEIIWARPNPMPESVTDRPTKSHSTVFLLSKRPRYFYDADAIREAYAEPERVARRREVSGPGTHHYDPTSGERVKGAAVNARMAVLSPQAETLDGSEGESPRGPDGRRQTHVTKGDNSEQHRDGERWPNPSGANARSVWQIATEPTPFAHFATWPSKLVGRMILAGTSERGVCHECGAPWVRETERELIPHQEVWNERGGGDEESMRATGFYARGHIPSRVRAQTLGWSPSCDHDAQPVPATVLDPFAGSGTTMLVARKHGRRSMGIELNPEYCELVRQRTGQLSLLT